MKTIKLFIPVLIFLSVFSFDANAQKKNKQIYEAPNMPLDANNKINYTKVVEVNGSAKELKAKALKWFHSYFTNSSNIIKKNTDTLFIGHPRFRVMYPETKKGIQTMKGIVEYNLKIYFKDNKYKYEITDFNLRQSSKYPIERWLDKNDPHYKNSYGFFLQQVDDYSKKIATDLEKAMSAINQQKNDDW